MDIKYITINFLISTVTNKELQFWKNYFQKHNFNKKDINKKRYKKITSIYIKLDSYK